MSEENKQNDSNGLSENRYESHEGRFLWMNVKALLCSLALIALFMFGFMWFYKMVKPSRFEGDNVKVSVYVRDDKGKLEKIDDKRLEVRVESVEVKEMPADTHDYSSFLVAFVAVLATFVVLGNFAQAHNLNRAVDTMKNFEKYRKGMEETIKQLEYEKGELKRGVVNALKNSKKELDDYVENTLKEKMSKIAEETMNDNSVLLDTSEFAREGMSFSDGRTKCEERRISKTRMILKKVFGRWKTDNQYCIGLYYKNRNDKEKAFKWFEKAAVKGYAKAQLELGYYCIGDGGVFAEWDKARFWFERAADKGHVIAQYNLGVCYHLGEGVEKDMHKAVEWYRKAAEQGHAGAQNNLGLCYAKGEGVEKDMQKAVELCTKAAAQGNVDAKSSLAEMYYLGDGIEQDKKRAYEIFSEIAEEEDSGESYYYLGRIYEKDSDVVKTDIEKAKECYQKAANKGYKKAEERLKELRDKTDDNPTEEQ